MPDLTVSLPDASACNQSTIEIGLPLTRGEAASETCCELSELTGLPFTACDLQSGSLLGGPLAELVPQLPGEILERLRRDAGPHRVTSDRLGLVFYGIAPPGMAKTGSMAVGFLLQDPERPARGLRVAIDSAGWSGERWDLWQQQQPVVSPPVLKRLLKLAGHHLVTTDETRSAGLELDSLAEELDSVYEELSLLHDVARDLRISLAPSELANVCLKRLHRSLAARGCAILLNVPGHETSFAVSGHLPFKEETTLSTLLDHFREHEWSRPIVRNHLQAGELGAAFPGLNNFVIAAAIDGPDPLGWIVAVNSTASPEFGSVEASLLSSIALILGTHVRNTLLFLEQEDLLVSFVRSLVSSLDAKDSYTRGHSERVALVARRLAREIGLSLREEESVHLSALLHDIGKIGVADEVLQKPDMLSAVEFEELKKHPVIGAEILSGLKNLRHILPGVRHHHESLDGSGYPDGLVGSQIPLMARIIAVADAYDAMRSDRPYRGGLPLDRIEDRLTAGSGGQWDPQIVRAYFGIRDEIARIWADSARNTLASD